MNCVTTLIVYVCDRLGLVILPIRGLVRNNHMIVYGHLNLIW